MSITNPEIEGVSIALVGSFNPSIYQPFWFSTENLVRKEEAESAKIEIIHPEVVTFTMADIQFQVTHERFWASSSHTTSYDLIRDIVLGAFQILSHTPIKMMGLNRDLHFRSESEESWHRFGHSLAPPQHFEGLLQKPGMRTLTEEGVRPDTYSGFIRIKIEPSLRVHPGIYVNVNDHYQKKDVEAAQGSNEIMEILKKEWRTSLERSTKIALSLMARL